MQSNDGIPIILIYHRYMGCTESKPKPKIKPKPPAPPSQTYKPPSVIPPVVEPPKPIVQPEPAPVVAPPLTKAPSIIVISPDNNEVPPKKQ